MYIDLSNIRGMGELEDFMKNARKKRQGYITKDSAFLSVAAIMSMRSKDPDTQNGACIVDQNDRILSVGYNGLPLGCSDDDFPWNRHEEQSYMEKIPYVIHAENNAISNCPHRHDLVGSRMYLYSERGYFPCSFCAQAIINARIKAVIMATVRFEPTDRYDWRPTIKMFQHCGIDMFVGCYSMGDVRSSGTFKDMSVRFAKVAELSAGLENEAESQKHENQAPQQDK